MTLELLKCKIHRVTVTEARLDYIGSITIDSQLMEAAGIFPGERVYIVDNNNGERFDTYAIAGEPGSGVICLNGAAAPQGAGGRRSNHHVLRTDDTRRKPAPTSPWCSSPTPVPTNFYKPSIPSHPTCLKI